MPIKPKRPCRHPGCPELVDSGYCEKHTKQEQRSYDKQRGTAAERGYNYRWSLIRLRFLKEFPLCYDCLALGRVEVANEVHHIEALRDGGTNEWNNLMSLSKACHSKRTARGE